MYNNNQYEVRERYEVNRKERERKRNRQVTIVLYFELRQPNGGYHSETK